MTRFSRSSKTARWKALWVAVLTALLAVALSSCGVPRGGGTSLSFPGLSTTEVSFTGNGGVTLHGSVVAPPADGTAHPAVVLVQGAGPVTRGEFAAEAEAFARRGIVTLVYDKRTAGYSSVHRDYSVLADDALAGVLLLRARPGVDPARTGIWGLSEGAWVAALAADRSTDVSFLVTVGAVGLSPARQQAWSYGEFLQHAGVSGSLRQMMQNTGVRQTVAAGLFPEADYDPVPSWEQVRQPVLALWGTLDREAAPVESSGIVRQALERGGNTDWTIRFVPGARHDLHVTADGGFDRPDGLAPGSADLVASWIDGRPVPAGAAPPQQDRVSSALAPLAWYESPWGQLGALVLFALAFLGYPLTAAVRRIRRVRVATRTPLPTRGAARLLAVFGAATVLGWLGYFLFLVLTAAGFVGPVVLGRPLPWLVLQLLAVCTVLATARTARVSWLHRTELGRGARCRLGLLITAGAVFVPWALYWGLLRP
ncbi:dienelactone hydrolase [Kitasatospora sp. MAA4]|uniref:alpha/beta hydrolase family protein n=1 Tax=Kitasatospora sp. MAA4 TaxID=3035093 RepID=UPI002475BC94|nr:prolyl oligopeptidase family serine peptidase [Kitasatospora sp. MAA4]MDH6135855.1 dienelactone hydrolase [Kitasatospora sp. MAA4]